MQTTLIGDTKVSVIGQGTYGFSGALDNHRVVDPFVDALRFGYDLGMTLVDTAEIYGRGDSERIVGKSIEGRNREDIFIATKVWTSNLMHDDVLKACKRSLARLNTKYIDLYQIHWPNHSVPMKETMLAFDELMDSGLIRNIGVSNFSMNQMREAQDALTKFRIVSNQVPFSLDEREIETSVIPYCRKNEIAVIAYSPLKHTNFGRGNLAKTLNQISKDLNKTPRQIALNWLISKSSIPIPKASKIEHVKENSEASDFVLGSAEMAQLNSL